jgi:enamine deaminase RidA (YjgF/YER057c/UK114 family)
MAPKGAQFFEDDGGFGAQLSKLHNYSQAVSLPHGIIKVSGQGGWTEDGTLVEDLQDHINLAFDNVEKVLKVAGATGGWNDVYLVRAFVVGLDSQTLEAVSKTVKEKWTSHKPVFTCVGVPALAIEGMRIEVEAEALKP